MISVNRHSELHGLENSIDYQNYTIDSRNEELYSSIVHLYIIIKDEIRSNLHGCAILSKCQYHGSQGLNILLHSKHFIRVSMKQHLEYFKAVCINLGSVD